MRRPRSRLGFTLVEVTLAIVVGIVLIAGATMIYNQAKASAGDSRAQAKVVALQSLVEEFAAMNDGVYPTRLADINALWQRKRPDDWNKSPWGGLVGSSFTAGGVASAGTGVASQVVAGALTTAFDLGTTAGRPPDGTAATTAANSGLAGGLVCDVDPANTTWAYAQDLITNSAVEVRGYAIYICDQQGRFPKYVTGPRVL
jgi:type II secretory pathway pseudopilin PulG